MKTLSRWAGAVALALALPVCALAQSIAGTTIKAPANIIPATAIYCDDGTGHAVVCSFSAVTPAATSTDRGASVGVTAVQLMAANASRKGFSVQVQSTSANCWINSGATATADYHSLKISAGTYFESPASFVPTGAISIICDTAATSVFAREW